MRAYNDGIVLGRSIWDKNHSSWSQEAHDPVGETDKEMVTTWLISDHYCGKCMQNVEPGVNCQSNYQTYVLIHQSPPEISSN